MELALPVEILLQGLEALETQAGLAEALLDVVAVAVVARAVQSETEPTAHQIVLAPELVAVVTAAASWVSAIMLAMMVEMAALTSAVLAPERLH